MPIRPRDLDAFSTGSQSCLFDDSFSEDSYIRIGSIPNEPISLALGAVVGYRRERSGSRILLDGDLHHRERQHGPPPGHVRAAKKELRELEMWWTGGGL